MPRPIQTTLKSGEKYYKFENGLIEKITKDGKNYIIHQGNNNYYNTNTNSDFNDNNFNENEFLKENNIKKLINSQNGAEVYEFS